MEPLRVTSRLVIPPAELEFRAVRSSGPGGQNVNKVSTAVVLRYDIRGSRILSDEQRARLLDKLGPRLVQDGTLQVRAEAERTQLRNLNAARERLRELLVEALKVQRRRRATQPTSGSKRRRLDAKGRRSNVKRLRRKPGDGD